MRQLEVKIAEHKRIAEGFYKMRLSSAYLAKNSKPGQFVEIKCSEGDELLLRRPLGVHRILNGGIEVLYEVVGKGTELLSRKRPGEVIDVIGPLGNGFYSPRSTIRDPRSAVLIAGGVGIAPLVALAQDLINKKLKVIVIIGAKKGSHILCEKELKRLGCEVKIATEDGSLGHKGLATDLLCTTHNAQRTTIYACGPNPMLKAVAEIAENHGISCQVSIEERMACGVGVCLGCPVKVREFEPANPQTRKPANYKYKMVCKDGPVFDAKEIVW
jgi:dihydroorotate dehydrogenase electron transfer subunit